MCFRENPKHTYWAALPSSPLFRKFNLDRCHRLLRSSLLPLSTFLSTEILYVEIRKKIQLLNCYYFLTHDACFKNEWSGCSRVQSPIYLHFQCMSQYRSFVTYSIWFYAYGIGTKTPMHSYSLIKLGKIFEYKIVIIFLPINFNICFGYSKEPLIKILLSTSKTCLVDISIKNFGSSATIHMHTLCMWAAMVLTRLCGCAGSQKSLLLAEGISSKTSCIGSYFFLCLGHFLLSWMTSRPTKYM